jgi:DNA (cytosine-5)-methyltransferase 1
MRVCDLFCGTGGFSVAFEKYGFQSVFANDIEPSSKQFYELNCKGSFILKDMNTFTKEEIHKLPDFDILTGGFSCQPFSIAGKKLGFKDNRSDVFWKVLDFLEIKRPLIFLLENVKNLVSHDDGNSFHTILECLKEKGYYVKYSVLDTSKVSNIPQGRERIYIIGFLDEKKYEQFEFPQSKKRECVPIHSLLEENVSEKYFYDTSKIYDKIKDEIKDEITEKNTVYQYRRHYIRQNKSGLVPTLTKNMGSGGHNCPLIKYKGRIRKLTPKECFMFQGFPETYKLPVLSDSKLYQFAGNAISVCVVEKIIEKLQLVL